MWKFTVAMSWVWFANSLVYYGVIVMTPEYFSVGGGKTTYPAVFLATLAELPSFIVCGIMINYIGRKITLAANFILCGVFVMCLMIPGPLWLSTIFAVFARMFITGCYNSTAAFTREVFPTVIRNSGTGFCISMSYVASIVTLFIGTSLLNYSLWACVAVYTGFAAIGALCSMLVPVETSGKALSDNIVPHLSEPIPPKQIDLPEDVVEELPELKRVQTI
jgi:putative MFS transporter